ncbi:hypothetical protein HanIR_Chr03g0105421 [Helianthus annuus]|nr:hypothetical protein HanIR_Chr03g0105421 [Helianthus annuus]
MRFSHLAWPYRPTPGLKAKPQGATPQPKPTRGGGLGVLPQPTPQPKPHNPRPNNNIFHGQNISSPKFLDQVIPKHIVLSYF